MGYTTTFSGTLQIKSDLTKNEIKFLRKIEGEVPDDICKRYEAKYGRLSWGCFDFQMNDDMEGFEWNGGEKTYDAEKQIQFIIDECLSINPKFLLEGVMLCQGEDPDDRWRLVVKKNKVTKQDLIVDGKVTCPKCKHAFDIDDQ